MTTSFKKICIFMVFLVSLWLLFVRNTIVWKLKIPSISFDTINKEDLASKSELVTAKKDIYNGAYKPINSRYIIFTNQCDDTTQCVLGHIDRYGGLADRMKGIYFAYLWALITNRTFLLHIQKPCALESYYDENQIRWRHNLAELLREMYNGSKSFARIEIFNTGNNVIYENNIQIGANVLNNLFEYQNTSDIILYKGNLMNTEVFMNISKHVERLKALGLNPFDIGPNGLFKHIFEILFKLSPKLQSKYDAFRLRAKPNADSKLICAQVRAGDYAILQNMKVDQAVSVHIFEHIKENFKSELNKSQIFLTADSMDALRDAQAYFHPKSILHTDGDIAHILDQKEMDKCERYDKSFLDFYILKDCDAAVVSCSGFGRLGIYKTGKMKNMFLDWRPFDLDYLRELDILRSFHQHVWLRWYGYTCPIKNGTTFDIKKNSKP